MRINETIATYDVGLALRGKSGRFEITSPTGEVYDVTCKPNHSDSRLEWSSDGNDHSPFLIRKVAERPSASGTEASAGMVEEKNQAGPTPRPFVLEHGTDGNGSSNVGRIELLYLDDEQGTGQPSACVSLRSESGNYAVEPEAFMTARCTTFNELDSELRRIESQLDEIRSRAKKMFYKAYAVAESA
ncbi:MAG: hypothetical protein ABSB14_02820 [Candidatus Sulfotelmatobacter sp.]